MSFVTGYRRYSILNKIKKIKIKRERKSKEKERKQRKRKNINIDRYREKEIKRAARPLKARQAEY